MVTLGYPTVATRALLVALVLTACAPAPSSDQFAGQVSAPAGDADAALEPGDASGGEVPVGAEVAPAADGGDTTTAADAQGDVPDAADASGAGDTADAADAADGKPDSTAADAVQDDTTNPDIACGCVSDPECGGITTATCQVAVCKACECLVQLAPDGTTCGAGVTCQQGKCLPKPKPGPWAKAIVAGGNHTCALHPDGTASCWGSNSQGQLGIGSTQDQPAPLNPVALGGIAMLAVGNSHTCALHGGGKVSCWGDRFIGQTGSGSKDGKALVPESAGTIADALLVAAGTYSSFAVRKGATLWGWGANGGGQMLLGNLLSQPDPVAIAPMLDVKRACGGDQFACALHGTGTVDCWGRNTDGQVGHGAASYDSPPLPAGAVNNLPAVVDLTCGHYHACAWDAAGKAWCWGKNLSGQLGTGSYTSDPVNAAISPTGLLEVIAIAGGQSHTCAVRKSGQVVCFGDNDAGKSGAGSAYSAYTPQVVDIGGKATAIAIGEEHSCALRDDGAVLCWGENMHGQLGNGGGADSATAVLVVGSQGL